MSVPTFKECKKILEDFYKQREYFIIPEISIFQEEPFISAYSHANKLGFKTFTEFKKDKFLISNFYKNLKPLITYVLSYTRLRKSTNCPNLFLKEAETTLIYEYEHINREVYVKNVIIILKTYYDFYDLDYDIFFCVLAELENNNELTVSHEIEDEDEDEEELENNNSLLDSYVEPPPEKPKIINLFKIFKSDECVICMDNKPNILFCNCGHLCECEGCYKIKTPSICPVCKMDNEIIRMIE